MTVKKLASLVAQREGKKSQARIETDMELYQEFEVNALQTKDKK